MWHARADRGGEDDPFIELSEAYKRILEDLDRSRRSGARNPGGVPRDGRRPVPHDPDWNPELVLDDRPPPVNRLPKPPDPRWDPDLVVRAEDPALRLPPGRLHPKFARKVYFSWLRRVGDEAARREPVWQSRAARIVGLIIILGILGGNLWLCWVAWSYDPAEAGRAATREAWDPARAAAGQPESSRSPPRFP